MELTKQKCVPCEGGILPFNEAQILEHQNKLKSPWEVIDGKKIHKEFIFKNFLESMAFINKIAEISEKQGHHPDISVFYNKVVIELWTHAINGLFLNDFIVAAQIDELI